MSKVNQDSDPISELMAAADGLELPTPTFEEVGVKQEKAGTSLEDILIEEEEPAPAAPADPAAAAPEATPAADPAAASPVATPAVDPAAAAPPDPAPLVLEPLPLEDAAVEAWIEKLPETVSPKEVAKLLWKRRAEDPVILAHRRHMDGSLARIKELATALGEAGVDLKPVWERFDKMEGSIKAYEEQALASHQAVMQQRDITTRLIYDKIKQEVPEFVKIEADRTGIGARAMALGARLSNAADPKEPIEKRVIWATRQAIEIGRKEGWLQPLLGEVAAPATPAAPKATPPAPKAAPPAPKPAPAVPIQQPSTRAQPAKAPPLRLDMSKDVDELMKEIFEEGGGVETGSPWR